jgi:hypothetical protein
MCVDSGQHVEPGVLLDEGTWHPEVRHRPADELPKRRGMSVLFSQIWAAVRFAVMRELPDVLRGESTPCRFGVAVMWPATELHDVDDGRGPLQAAALEYLQAGWPIVALSPDGARVVANMSPRGVAMAQEWWSQRPYGIGVWCGEAFDALEVPAAVGESVAVELRRRARVPVPVFEVPLRGWFVLVSAGCSLMAELVPFRRVVRVHGHGCWVPLPPTRSAGLPALWVSRGRAPHALLAQTCVAAVLRNVAFGQGRS